MSLLKLLAPSAPSSGGELPAHDRLRRELRIIVIAWVFGSLWLWTINGAAMTRFAQALHTPGYAFGILAALPFVGTLFQVPAAWFLERYGYRKVTFLVLMTVCRILWTAVAVIPWVMPGLDRWWWMAMVALLLVSWSVGNATGPAWMGWMADVIPRRIRGRYFATRNRIGQMVGVLTTLIIGYGLDLAEQSEVVAPGTMLKITSIMLALAGLVGVLDIQLFTRIRDEHRPDPAKAPQGLYAFFQPLRDRHFRHYLGFTFTISLATGFIGQYVMLYALDVLQMGNQRANLLSQAFPLVTMLISYPFWGRLMDRLGRKPVLIIAGAAIVLGAFGWVLVGKDAGKEVDWGQCFHELASGRPLLLLKGLLGWDWGWQSRIGYLLVMLSTFSWPGVEGAAFNIILDMTDDREEEKSPCPNCGSEKRRTVEGRAVCAQCGATMSVGSSENPGAGAERRAPGTVYVAINSIAGAVGGILSGLLAGGVAWWLTDGWHWTVPVVGVFLTYHGILFLGSTVLRVVAVALACNIREPRAVGTRQALNYMTSNLYANVRDVLWWPTRALGQAYGWTSRFNPRRPPGPGG